jgi:lipoyl(octanoyl) transferase
LPSSRRPGDSPFLPTPGSAPVEWVAAAALVGYERAVTEMEARAEAIAAGEAAERVWLVEHPPLYTAGTSAKAADLLDARFPVFKSGRGGQYTYHGPGQRVAYVMLDLKRRRPDLRAFVGALEGWLIDAIATFGVSGRTHEARVGVWTPQSEKPAGLNGEPAEDKIAAIGVRVRRWATFHGVALNVAPNLSHFEGVVPCGIADAHLGVTSLRDLGLTTTMEEADAALRASFERRFGPTIDAT